MQLFLLDGSFEFFIWQNASSYLIIRMVMNMAKKKIKVKWHNVFKFFSFILTTAIAIYFGMYILSFYRDYRKEKLSIESLRTSLKIVNTVDDENTVITPPEANLSKFSPYWNFIKLSFIEPDYATLTSINPDIIGWIEIKGTDISYPVLDYRADDFYSDHAFDGQENYLGSIRLNAPLTENLTYITTIVGNKTNFNILFGNLKKTLSDEWQKNESNHIIKFSTKYSTTLWQIVSIYRTNNEDIWTSDEFRQYEMDILSKSVWDFKTSLSTDDKLLTLTTSANDKNIVIHAKLLKIKNIVNTEKDY